MDCRKVVLLVSVVVFISPIVAADHFEVDVEVVSPTVTAGEGEEELFNITVTNTGSVDEGFTLMEPRGTMYAGPYPRSHDLGPGESGYSMVYVNPRDDRIAGRTGTLLTVIADNGERTVADPHFRIDQEQDLLITGFDTDQDMYQPGENVTATVSVQNVMPRQLDRNEYQAVFSMDNRTESSGIAGLREGEEDQYTATLDIGQYDYGLKQVSVEVNDLYGNTHDEQTARIDVAESPDVMTNRDRSFNGVSDTWTMAVENRGNAPAEDTEVSAAVPSYLRYFTSFDMEPDESVTLDGEVRYTWNVGTLAPGDQQTITYRINYWVPLAIIVVLLVTAGIGLYEYRRPVVKKKSFEKNGNHSVHLIVRNKSGKVMDNVVVRDFIPSIATLVEKFDSSPPEKIRKGEEGTELDWKLGRIDPGEERILTYRLSPQVEVEGNVSLPAARLEYKSGKKQKKRHSHHTTADFT